MDQVYKPLCMYRTIKSRIGVRCTPRQPTLTKRQCLGKSKGPVRVASAGGHPMADATDDWYTPLYMPRRAIGPVKVAMREGRGRGVIATDDISAGQLIMLVPCLDMVPSPLEQQPPIEALVNKLMASSSSSPWLDLLYTGTTKSTREVPDLQAELGHSTAVQEQPPKPAAARLDDPPQQGSSSSSNIEDRHASVSSSTDDSSSSSSSSSIVPELKNRPQAGKPFRVGRPPAQEGRWPATSKKAAAAAKAAEKHLKRVVALNAYGELHGDYAAAALTGSSPGGFVGLWPEFAMLNHSCAPNATHWVFRHCMMVRAVQDISAGEEVTVSYMGRPQLFPLRDRAEVLKSQYGFDCDCPRCQGEAACFERVGPLLEDIQDQIAKELQPASLAACKGEDPAGALVEVRSKAAALLLGLYSRFRKTLVTPQQRLWCLASVSSCLELVATADIALQDWPAAQASLGSSLKALEAVTLGSDLHAITAAQAAEVARKVHGEGSSGHAAAEEQCRRAQRLRYGPVSDALAEELAELNRTLYS